MKRWVMVGLAAAVTALVGCNSGDRGADDDPTAIPLVQADTLSCLRRSGATVSPLEPFDPVMRMLRDLAQRSAFEVRTSDTQLAIAFGRDVAGAILLEELLQVPADEHRIERRGNAVLVQARDAPGLSGEPGRCLQTSR